MTFLDSVFLFAINVPMTILFAGILADGFFIIAMMNLLQHKILYQNTAQYGQCNLTDAVINGEHPPNCELFFKMRV